MRKTKGRGSAFWPWFELTLSLCSLVFGAYFAVKWVTTDEVDVYTTCSRGSGTCVSSGETLNMMFGLIWGGLGLVGTVIGVVWVIRHRRRAAADQALIAGGRHGDAVITDVQQRGSVTRTNGRITSQGYLLTLDPGDGGAPLNMKVELPPGVMEGMSVRVAYDPMTRDAVLLEDPTETTLFAST